MTLEPARRLEGDGSRHAVWRREIARLDRLRVVAQAQAQDIVAAAEHTDLTRALAAARQRVVDPGGWLRHMPTEIRRPSPRRRSRSRMPAEPWRV